LPPLFSSEALDQGSFFDSFNRPYTPSYNSASAFEAAFSDQDDIWSGTGSHFEEADFEFGTALNKGPKGLAYDPETADNYNNLDSVLLAAHTFGQSKHHHHNSARSSGLNDRGSTGLPTLPSSDQENFRDNDEKSPIASPLLGAATSPSHTRHSSFASNLDPTPALDLEQAWMQSLGQRISLSDDNGAQSRHLQQQLQNNRHRQSASLQEYSSQPHFAPVFEEEGGHGSEEHTNYSGQQFPSYTYSQPASHYQHNFRQEEASDSQIPLLAISGRTLPFRIRRGLWTGDPGPIQAIGKPLPTTTTPSPTPMHHRALWAN